MGMVTKMDRTPVRTCNKKDIYFCKKAYPQFLIYILQDGSQGIRFAEESQNSTGDGAGNSGSNDILNFQAIPHAC